MNGSDKEDQLKNKITEIKTFSVPIALGEIKENISIPTHTSSKITKEQIINKAFKLHSQGNILEAARYYQYFINQGFKNHIVFSNYGSILKGLSKLKEAELLYRKAIEINPNCAEAYSNLGNIFRDFGKLKEAELSYQKAIAINPNCAEAYSNLGNIFRDFGKLKEAELSYRKAIEIKSDCAEAHSNLGVLLKDLGKLKEAELSIRKAIEYNPNYAEAHSNLGNILVDYRKLEEAEKSIHKALKLNPKNESIKHNLINLLTIYKPKKIESNLLYRINEEFKEINLIHKENFLITDNEAIRIYKDGLIIYKKYNLKLEINLSQIYKKNEVNLNCNRHKLIFNQHKIIPEFCFSCYKVQVEVDSIIELIKLFLVFNQLKLKNNNTRKSIIELRPNISGFYKGLIYCSSLTEAFKISKKLNIHIQNNIRIDLLSKVKRGCSEYPLEFPQYKEIATSGDQPMNYNESWRAIEKEIDQDNKNWGELSKSIDGFNLNDFLIMRNWIAYAQKIKDTSVSKITNEQIKEPKFFKHFKRDILSKQTSNSKL
ncbi:tetratricopeptide repeat protein [Prochlorococcus marinus]|uniref:tetratricopeptide repeat protein n=1 Tax=Prochlorococcus marinus TaxID=1219 RepID=UPI0022B301D7|nr:tetratricopeptide repeat protein [Prochlorococcus marinus]